MATRLEKETILREKQQLQARLDKLFAAQERQTASKKRSKNFKCGGKVRKMPEGGKFGQMWTNTKANFGVGGNQYAPVDYGLGYGRDPINYGLGPVPYQSGFSGFYPQIPQTIPGVNVSPGGQQGPYPTSFSNSPYGPNAGIDSMAGATEWDRDGNIPPDKMASQQQASSYSGVPGKPTAVSPRSEPLNRINSVGGYAHPGMLAAPNKVQPMSPAYGGDQLMATADQSAYNPYLSNVAGVTPSSRGRQPAGERNLFPQGGSRLMGGLATAASFAGPLYDVFRGLSKPTQFNVEDYYNPQYGRALEEYNRGIQLMRNRRYDPNAELEDVERTGAVARQGLRNLPTGLGALQNRLASQNVREQRQKGQILTKTQNINQQYRGDEAQYRARAAQGMAGLGSERARTRFSIADYNERNAAQRRNMLSAGLGGIGMGAQVHQQMGNQRMRDEQLMGILPSFGGGLYGFGQSGGIEFGAQGQNPEWNRRYVRGYGYR